MIVPLVALLATSGLLAPEIDDGSISYLLAKPISRHTIVASKLVVAVGLRGRVRRGADAGRGLVLLPRRARVSASASPSARWSAGSAYCALFALLSVMTRHAVVLGLVYLLIWEGLLGGLLDGVRWLSITRWSGEMVDRGRRPRRSSTTCRWRTP